MSSSDTCGPTPDEPPPHQQRLKPLRLDKRASRHSTADSATNCSTRGTSTRCWKPARSSKTGATTTTPTDPIPPTANSPQRSSHNDGLRLANPTLHSNRITETGWSGSHPLCYRKIARCSFIYFLSINNLKIPIFKQIVQLRAFQPSYRDGDYSDFAQYPKKLHLNSD